VRPKFESLGVEGPRRGGLRRMIASFKWCHSGALCGLGLPIQDATAVLPLFILVLM
jgi:hypothetical protein